jgi:hypothetical protein
MLTEYEAYVLTKERLIGRAPPLHGRRRLAPTDLGVILVLLVVLLAAGSFTRLQRVDNGASWETQQVAASPAKSPQGEASHD